MHIKNIKLYKDIYIIVRISIRDTIACISSIIAVTLIINNNVKTSLPFIIMCLLSEKILHTKRNNDDESRLLFLVLIEGVLERIKTFFNASKRTKI